VSAKIEVQLCGGEYVIMACGLVPAAVSQHRLPISTNIEQPTSKEGCQQKGQSHAETR